MGLMWNFTQAFRGFTGSGKDKEAEKRNLPIEELVDELEKAVEAYGGGPRVKKELKLKIDDTPANITKDAPADIPKDIPASPPKDTSADIPKDIPDDTPKNAPASEIFTAEAKKDTPALPFEDMFNQSADEKPVIEEPVEKPVAQTSAGGQGATSTNTGGGRFAGNFAEQAAFTGSRQKSDDNANEITIISKNTIVDGNIRSFADISIDGGVRGDVETTKNIDLNGRIIGDIACSNASMQNAQVQGSIRIKGNISMKHDTLLIGDLMSTYAEINGKIKGNLEVAGKAQVKSDAVVFGDINASTIMVEDGAVIQGHVNTTYLNKEESMNLFPEAIVLGDA